MSEAERGEAAPGERPSEPSAKAVSLGRVRYDAPIRAAALPKAQKSILHAVRGFLVPWRHEGGREWAVLTRARMAAAASLSEQTLRLHLAHLLQAGVLIHLGYLVDGEAVFDRNPKLAHRYPAIWAIDIDILIAQAGPIPKAKPRGRPFQKADDLATSAARAKSSDCPAKQRGLSSKAAGTESTLNHRTVPQNSGDSPRKTADKKEMGSRDPDLGAGGDARAREGGELGPPTQPSPSAAPDSGTDPIPGVLLAAMREASPLLARLHDTRAIALDRTAETVYGRHLGTHPSPEVWARDLVPLVRAAAADIQRRCDAADQAHQPMLPYDIAQDLNKFIDRNLKGFRPGVVKAHLAAEALGRDVLEYLRSRAVDNDFARSVVDRVDRGQIPSADQISTAKSMFAESSNKGRGWTQASNQPAKKDWNQFKAERQAAEENLRAKR